MTEQKKLWSASPAMLGLMLLATPALAGTVAGPAYVPDMLPPNPTAGECYVRVEIPAQYETTAQTVVTREAHTRLQVEPPKLVTRTEQVMVKEPSVQYVVRQPSYRTVTEQVLTRPGYEKLSVSQPSFEARTETIQQSAPRLVWKKGNPGKLRAMGYKIHSTADAGIGGQGYSSTTQYGRMGGERCGPMCEIWCLVEEPGDSVTVTRQVMTQSGQIQRTPVPPAYETIHKQVVADPGGVEEVPVPAEYRTLQIQDLVHQGGAAQIEVPAEYGQVQGRRLISESRYEWRRAVCAPGTAVRRQSSHHTSGHVTQGNVTHGYATQGQTAPLAGGSRTYRSSTHSVTPAGATGYTTRTYMAPTTVQSGQTVVRTHTSSNHPDPAYSGPAYSSQGYVSSDVTVAGQPVYVRRKP